MMTMTRNSTGGADADLTLRDHLDPDLTLPDPDPTLPDLIPALLGLDRGHRGHRDREGVLDVEEEARVPAEVPVELAVLAEPAVLGGLVGPAAELVRSQ